MDTYFASPEKSSATDLQDELDVISRNPVIDSIMTSVGGVIAVLNENRQIVRVNQVMLEHFGVTNTGDVFGLRPGEAIGCVHASQFPAGCGTTEYCSTCGAAIAIAVSQETGKSAERLCVADVTKNNTQQTCCFLVRCSPVSIENHQFLLLFLTDVTKEKLHETLEKAFIHDIGNIVSGLVVAGEMLRTDSTNQKLLQTIQTLTARLKTEFDIQKIMSTKHQDSYVPTFQKTTIVQLIDEIKSIFAIHPLAKEIKILYPENAPDNPVKTDISLCIRILSNMLTNALEASNAGETIRLTIDHTNSGVTFFVWNKATIHPDVQRRIFQKHFSTKGENGRGLGTFSMKMFGEKILKGKVSFLSTDADGTVFTLCIPWDVAVDFTET